MLVISRSRVQNFRHFELIRCSGTDFQGDWGWDTSWWDYYNDWRIYTSSKHLWPHYKLQFSACCLLYEECIIGWEDHQKVRALMKISRRKHEGRASIYTTSLSSLCWLVWDCQFALLKWGNAWCCKQIRNLCTSYGSIRRLRTNDLFSLKWL